MRNLLLKIAYCGRNYHGFQIQQNALTVQAVLQNAIWDLVGQKIDIKGCSRTDTGAHANEYFVSFKTHCDTPCRGFVRALNALLPADIVAHDCEEKPLDFHARYDVKKKEYIYRLLNCECYDPFLEGLVYHYHCSLNYLTLNELAVFFVGTHSFKATSAKNSGNSDFIRRVYSFNVNKIGDIIQFQVVGNGFLYKMVRIMVGTLIDFSRSGKTGKDISALISSEDRQQAGKTVPACGLYLNRVVY
ncbi:MAG: tRNA pseudouridine(38-40) synthase TruA [Oscillospiraceae bacterium]|nr:tRNA pseudouridine(38-40) synthase TruA [Oscillospiraceae bacterium]